MLWPKVAAWEIKADEINAFPSFLETEMNLKLRVATMFFWSVLAHGAATTWPLSGTATLEPVQQGLTVT